MLRASFIWILEHLFFRVGQSWICSLERIPTTLYLSLVSLSVAIALALPLASWLPFANTPFWIGAQWALPYWDVDSQFLVGPLAHFDWIIMVGVVPGQRTGRVELRGTTCLDAWNRDGGHLGQDDS